MRIIYEAADGKQFEDMLACETYEKTELIPKAFDERGSLVNFTPDNANDIVAVTITNKKELIYFIKNIDAHEGLPTREEIDDLVNYDTLLSAFFGLYAYLEDVGKWVLISKEEMRTLGKIANTI